MNFDDRVSWTLRLGVAISITFIAVGIGLIALNRGGAGYNIAEIFTTGLGINTAQYPPASIFANLGHADGLYLVLAGLIVLIATPILRVVMSLIGFAVERNWTYTAITAMVLIGLAFALLVLPGIITH